MNEQIKLLTTCFGWEEGHVTDIVDEDEGKYYFNNEWGRLSSLDKSKDGIVFKIVEKE